MNFHAIIKLYQGNVIFTQSLKKNKETQHFEMRLKTKENWFLFSSHSGCLHLREELTHSALEIVPWILKHIS